MLRKLLNQVEVEIALEPAEPLLVASGVPNVGGIDMPFVLTYRSGTDTGEPYLPGSSLKGVFRSHAERISRTVAPRARVCDPHCHDEAKANQASIRFCGDQLRPSRSSENDAHKSHELYRKSCPICRTFGSTVYRGRFAVGDAYLKDGSSHRLERRDGVGIDRFSGGASRGAKFEMEVLTKGTFRTRLRLENFEDWQLGILCLLCRDLEDELISIGHSTTRGLGRLRGTIERFDVMYVVPPSRQLSERQVYGVGSLLEKDERQFYGYREDDRFEMTQPSGPAFARQGVRLAQSLAEAVARRALFDDAIARWSERMENWGTA